MNFSLSRFTEFICELQSQKTFGYQSLFKLLEKYYGVEKILLVSGSVEENDPERKGKIKPVKYICRHIDYDCVRAFFAGTYKDPFCRAEPPEDLLKKGMVSLEDLLAEGETKPSEYCNFLQNIEAEGEVCMYLQKDGKYIAALSFFLNTQTLSENEWEILKSTGKCISEMYLVAQKKVITKQKFFHEFFDGINIGAAILNQKMEIIDMNKTFSDFCKIIVRHGSIDTESVMSNLKGKQNEKNYAQSVINHLGANIIMRPEKIKIDCLLYNYRVYAKSVVFNGIFGRIHTATCVYLTEYKKICNPWVLDTLETLTPRELEILTMMAYGYDNHEIEEKCCISLNTIKTHQRNIYQKFNVANRSELISKLYLMNYRHK